MNLKKIYEITDWKEWDRLLDRATDRFHTTFGVFPNILVASPETHQKIDIAANKKRSNVLAANQEARDSEMLDPPIWIEIAEVALKHCVVELCVDERVPSDKVELIYDSSPEYAAP